MFAGFSRPPTDLARRFDSSPCARDAGSTTSIYYRTREEYNAALHGPAANRHHAGHLSSTPRARPTFSPATIKKPGTLYHEATHQLFHETRPRRPTWARNENFWIVEGIACYMESLAEHDDYTRSAARSRPHAGCPAAAARRRLLRAAGRTGAVRAWQTLQRDPRLPRLYSQSAGLTDFLMHDAEGRYREALIGYLSTYAGRATPGTLADLTDASYETLDRQYREFIALAAQRPWRRPPRRHNHLSTVRGKDRLSADKSGGSWQPLAKALSMCSFGRKAANLLRGSLLLPTKGLTMDTRGALKNGMASSQKIVDAYSGDLTDADLMCDSVPGINHLAWQLGHRSPPNTA